MAGTSLPDGVVRRLEDVAGGDLEPLLVLDPLTGFLDSRGIGSGELVAHPIGDGHSNVTFLLQRGDERFVLRRPPRGPLPRSAHDVLREARLLEKLGPCGYQVPEVLASSEDLMVIGAPFYVMTYVDGLILDDRLPPGHQTDSPRQIAAELVDALVALHEVDYEAAGLADLGRPGGYLERQLGRFRGLLALNATRPLPELERVADWLEQNLPSSEHTALVHGDFRLGNVMFAVREPRLKAVLDWEMATLGDPLADLGYMVEMWGTAGDPPNPVADLTPVTRDPRFPGREWLAVRYAAARACDLDALPWYRTLALWKSCIFLEGNYKRYMEGTTADPFFKLLGEGVPALASLAVERSEGA